MKNRWVIIAIVLSLFVLSFIYFASYGFFKTEEIQKLEARVSLYRSTLVNALERYQFLPFILSKDPFVIAGTTNQDLSGLNQRLKAFAKQEGLEAIYLMNKEGVTVAASNFDQSLNFIGQNYSFRPYFKAALEGLEGTFFGIGATTSRPGYFIARPVYLQKEVTGVVAIKIGLTALQETWRKSGENVFVSNKQGVIVLSSNQELLYKTLNPLDETSRDKILAGKQFLNQPLSALGWNIEGKNEVILNGKALMHVSSPVSKRAWRLHYLTTEDRVQERALFVVIIGAIAVSVWMTIFATIRSKRIRIALEASQKDRQLLQKANTNLEQEIVERRMAEERLQKAQEDLAQASKLAALGQLSASVTHELGQPIAAMRNYLVAYEFESELEDQSTTIERLNAIVLRMENITKQLRFFAEPGNNQLEEIDLRDIYKGARDIIAHNISASGVDLKVHISDKPIFIEGNRLRLEQVLINLLSNSILAMENSAVKEITIYMEEANENAILAVKDTGCGIANRTIEDLQEPFHTTRESGKGMGLGLAISAAIIKEHHGKIEVENNENCGASFSLLLPIKKKKKAA